MLNHMPTPQEVDEQFASVLQRWGQDPLGQANRPAILRTFLGFVGPGR